MVSDPRLLAARWAAIFERLEPQFGECWWTGLVSCHKHLHSGGLCPLAYVDTRPTSRKLCHPRKKDLIRLVPHFTTRKVRCVTPAPSITRVLSSSIGSGLRWSNNRTPSPSRTGTRSKCISSSTPALMYCCTRLAPTTPTSLSPAIAFACARALWRPSVTNVNGDLS